METNLRTNRSSQESNDVYPRVLADLNRAEIASLTQILHLNPTTNPRFSAQAQELIQKLPKRLRCKRLSLSGLGIKPSGLCKLHKPINPEVLDDILGLVHREVTVCFRPFDHYPEQVRSTEAGLLAKLRCLNGMWTKPSTSGVTANHGAWEYQINGCAGCMLSRVAADENAIGNLRSTLISRTRTGTKHKPRRLMPFVDESIRCYDLDKAEAIFNIASNYAYGLKEARKACSKASNAVHGGSRVRQKDKSDPMIGFSRLSIKERPSPDRNFAMKSLNSRAEWTAPSFPRTSGSQYSRGTDILTGQATTSNKDLAKSPLVSDVISQIDDAIEESSMYQFIFQGYSSESDLDSDVENVS